MGQIVEELIAKYMNTYKEKYCELKANIGEYKSITRMLLYSKATQSHVASLVATTPYDQYLLTDFKEKFEKFQIAIVGLTEAKAKVDRMYADRKVKLDAMVATRTACEMEIKSLMAPVKQGASNDIDHFNQAIKAPVSAVMLRLEATMTEMREFYLQKRVFNQTVSDGKKAYSLASKLLREIEVELVEAYVMLAQHFNF